MAASASGQPGPNERPGYGGYGAMTFWYTASFAIGVIVGFFVGAAALDRYYLQAYAANLQKLALDLKREAEEAKVRAKLSKLN
jgi:hypothetical protein